MTQVNKNEAIDIMVNSNLKMHLQRVADMDSRKLSEYIRL